MSTASPKMFAREDGWLATLWSSCAESALKERTDKQLYQTDRSLKKWLYGKTWRTITTNVFSYNEIIRRQRHHSDRIQHDAVADHCLAIINYKPHLLEKTSSLSNKLRVKLLLYDNIKLTKNV